MHMGLKKKNSKLYEAIEYIIYKIILFDIYKYGEKKA